MIRTLSVIVLLTALCSGADIFKLVQAIDRNDTVEFKQMVQTMSDANTARSDNNKSILMYTCWVGNEELVRYLVEKGADINGYDSSNATALHLAIWKDHTNIALFLIEKGASTNALSTDGMTPSDIAMLRSNTRVLEAIDKAKPKLKSLL